MIYREFGNTGEKVSSLGFGCMRFKVEDNDPKKIIEDEAIKLVRHAIDQGVNYIDTAYPYHGGMSELLVAKICKDGYRKKIKLATKLPSWLIKQPEDFDRYLNEQLEKLETESIDFYLIHALDRGRWDNMRPLGLLEFMDKAKEDGRIKHIGFSFHDRYEVFEEIVNGYDWDFCQIQMNIIDTDYQAGLKGLQLASDKGMGVIVMEPLRGGNIGDPHRVSQEIKDLWKKSGKDYSPAAWAFKYLYDMKEVGLVLSGMNHMSQVEENIRIASESTPGHLSPEDAVIIQEVKEVYLSKIQVGCTSCNYCMPCPHGVNIPFNFESYNNAYMLNKETAVRARNMFLSVEAGADQCVACGECEPKCPQHIPIIESLAKVAKYFD